MTRTKRYRIGEMFVRSGAKKVSRYEVVGVNYRTRIVTMKYRGVGSVNRKYTFDQADRIFTPLSANGDW